jgi:hypothetical protein
MGNEFTKKLNDLKGHKDMCPRSDWVKKNRAALLSQITSQKEEKSAHASFFFAAQRFTTLFVPQRLAFVARVFVVGLISVGMAMGGWMVTVSASSDSLPGNHVRYGVKLATEKAQVAVASATGNAKSEASLHLTFAARRADELKQIVEEEPVYVDETTERLKESMASVEENLQDLKDNDPTKVDDVAKQITEKTTDIINDLNDAAHDISGEGEEGVAAVKDLQDAKKAVNDTGIEAIGVLAQSEILGDEEIKLIVEEKIDAILLDAEEMKQDVDVVTEEVADGEIDISTTTTHIEGDISASSSEAIAETTTTDSIVEETGEIIAEVEEVVVSLEETVEKMGESIEKGQEVAGEVKELLEGNNVEEAVAKIKILHAMTSDTGEVLVGVEKTIQDNKKEDETSVEDVAVVEEEEESPENIQE